MQAAQTKYLRQRVARFGVFDLCDLGDRVNVVNVDERHKTVTFTAYPHESKGRVNVVNVARGFFMFRCTPRAKHIFSWGWANDSAGDLVFLTSFFAISPRLKQCCCGA
jgi:hypothetical protein